MTPLRAIIVGPPGWATSISASIAACHAGAADSFFGSAVMCRVAQQTSLVPSGNAIGSSNSRPRLTKVLTFPAPGRSNPRRWRKQRSVLVRTQKVRTQKEGQVVGVVVVRVVRFRNFV